MVHIVHLRSAVNEANARVSNRLPLAGQRSRGPTYVVWELTLRCNQACRFCGSRAGAARKDELSLEDCRSAIEQLAAMGVREISMHGGEAYLRKDWLEIVRAIRNHGMHPTLVTGGRGFTPELARAAKEAGMAAVSVSIDGCQETHDELRRAKHSHASALAAVEAVHDAGIPVGVITQVNRRNYPEFGRLTDLVTSLPLYGWQVQMLIPMGRAADSADLWVEPYMMLEIMPRVMDAQRRCRDRGFRIWAGDNLGYFGPYEADLRRGATLSGHCEGCGGAKMTLGLESHGDIKPCSAMGPEYVAGNVRHDRIQDVWQRSPKMKEMRAFDASQLWGYCRQCYYADACLAGCPWTSTTVLGRRGNNPYCHHRALELARTGQRERLRRCSAASGGIRDHGAFELIVEEAPPEWLERVSPHVGSGDGGRYASA